MFHEQPDPPPRTPHPGRRSDSGEALFLANLKLIERLIGFVCRRHHASVSDAEDFASHVRLKLIADEYAVLGKFEGRSSLQTFLNVTIQRWFLDYRISAWGKWRPSAEAVRCGAVAVLLEQLTGRDGYSLDEAFELITTNHRVVISRAALEELAARLPARLRRRFEGDDGLANVASEQSADDDFLDAQRRRAQERAWKAVEEALAAMETQDRLIMRLRFEDGRTISEIAAMRHLEAKPLYSRVQRLLRELRGKLEQQGLGSEELFE